MRRREHRRNEDSEGGGRAPLCLHLRPPVSRPTRRATRVSLAFAESISVLTTTSYVRGKEKAERALKEIYGNNGVALRPTMIYGTRRVKSIPIPLGLVGAPFALVCTSFPALRTLPLLGDFFVPPVSVEVRSHNYASALESLVTVFYAFILSRYRLRIALTS